MNSNYVKYKSIVSHIPEKNNPLRPFLKWAGGKAGLIPQIIKRLPPQYLKAGVIPRYVEPFVGGGAVLFHLLTNFHVERAVIGDINPQLIAAYTGIKFASEKVIDLLQTWTSRYNSADAENAGLRLERKKIKKTMKKAKSWESAILFRGYGETKRGTTAVIFEEADGLRYMPVWNLEKDLKKYNAHLQKHGVYLCEKELLFYRIRSQLNNTGSCDGAYRAALFLFLNKTGFNGLCRYNRKGEFNVSWGKYPAVNFDYDNIRRVSVALQNVDIICGDFDEEIAECVAAGSLVYLDPPYRPLPESKNFTTYNGGGFNDTDQERLATCYQQWSARGAECILSNSDQPYFDDLYRGFEISRVQASRAINCSGSGRGKINEIMVVNR
ncbi:MAG: Dam family site-specific DNA-(adenine-N6)-methyltransferase [bacterium]|nr:Dam family site-specific DNA-(adenine-N6)-methyltransferase [bacterium]